MMDETGALLRRVDGYLEGLFAPPDEALEGALRRSGEAGLPEIQVHRAEGRLLQMLAEISGARRILEIGLLGGYSTIHLARALPDGGSLVSLELEERHAEVARENLAAAGLANRVEVRVGPAQESLAAMVEGGEGPFDLVFIDADKEGYPAYLEWALRLSRPGTMILADNVIRGGSVIEPQDATNRAVAEFNKRLADDPRLSATVIPFLRHRVDGLAVARVVSV
jgi:predicted O-methyltransferase YrrM